MWLSSLSLSPASLAGWELLAREKSDTVYRRLYKDTGLYQYKVIGRYHDITAKDYLEVQVCCMYQDSYCVYTLYTL